MENRVFVSLANGDIVVFFRETSKGNNNLYFRLKLLYLNISVFFKYFGFVQKSFSFLFREMLEGATNQNVFSYVIYIFIEKKIQEEVVSSLFIFGR